MEGGVIVLLVFGLFIYFIPTLVAFSRSHHNSMAINMLNLFLGWTFLGWVIALVWAFTAVRPVVDADPRKPDTSGY